MRAGLGVAPAHLLDAAGGEREIVDRGQVREEVELLEDDPDPLAHPGHVGALSGDLLALEEDATLLYRLEEVHTAQERALATPARADDDQHLAGGRRSGRSRRARGCRRSSCGRPRVAPTGHPLGDVHRLVPPWAHQCSPAVPHSASMKRERLAASQGIDDESDSAAYPTRVRSSSERRECP